MLLISLCTIALLLVFTYASTTQYNTLCGSTGFDWKWKKRVSRQIYPMVIFVLVLTSTLRFGFIDTYAYKDMYIATRNDLDYVFSAPFGVEAGWLLCCYLLNFISASPKIMLCLSALIINCAYVKCIKKHSCDPLFSILIYFCITYLDTNNGIRQMVAAGIMIMAFQMLLQNKRSNYVWFLVLTIIAMQFHVSASVCLLIAFVVVGNPFNMKTKLCLLLGVVFLIIPDLINDYIGELFNDSKYLYYLDYEGMGMSLPRALIVGVLPSLLGVFYILNCKRCNVTIKAEEAFLLNMTFVNTMFVVMGIYMQYWARFAFYTGFAPIILMPKLVYQTFNRKESNWMRRIAIAFYAVFFVYNIYVNVGYGTMDSFYIEL